MCICVVFIEGIIVEWCFSVVLLDETSRCFDVLPPCLRIFVVQTWVVVACLEVRVLVVCNGALLCWAFGRTALLIVHIKMLLSVVSVYIHVLCWLCRCMHVCHSVGECSPCRFGPC